MLVAPAHPIFGAISLFLIVNRVKGYPWVKLPTFTTHQIDQKIVIKMKDMTHQKEIYLLICSIRSRDMKGEIQY